MLKDITIGQYFPGDTFVHKLDPRVKILISIIFIVALFFIKDFYPYILIFAFILFSIMLSKIPISFVLKGLRPLMLIIIITFVINVFLTKGEVLYALGPLTITKEGLSQAVFMALRLIFLIIGTSLLTLTTSPISLTDGIESLLSPFKKIGLPAHELAMMMTIALRFIPTLLEETDKIMKAQIARGADLESGNMIQRVKAMIPVLVPLFVSAFRRANDLALAMEARCYRGGEGRTKMKPLVYRAKDYLAYAVIVLYMMLIFFVGRFVPFHIWIF